MGNLDPNSVHDRVSYVRDIYNLSDKFPSAFERFVLPLAAYDESGMMVRANSKFRRLTGLKEDDIQNHSANIFDYLNSENKGIAGAARQAFHDEEVIMEDLVCPLCPCIEADKKEISKFKNAVFFPMARGHECIICGGVLFMFDA